jgi:hypothetical protein
VSGRLAPPDQPPRAPGLLAALAPGNTLALAADRVQGGVRAADEVEGVEDDSLKLRRHAGHWKRRLRERSLVRRPRSGRSRTRTTGRSLTSTVRRSQPGQTPARATSAISNSSSSPRSLRAVTRKPSSPRTREGRRASAVPPDSAP